MKLKVLTKKEKIEELKKIELFCQKNEFKYKVIQQPKQFGGSFEVKIQVPDIKPFWSL